MGKIFGTDGIRCLVNEEPLTAETCLKISKTVAYLLKRKKNSKYKVVVCKDTRLSGYLYEPLITAGFISMGMNVILVGPLPTPAVPLLIKNLNADLGVMITASHNTFEYNGLKFFNSDGYKLNSIIEKKVEQIVLNNKKYSKVQNLTYKSGKAIRLEDASYRYLKFLTNTLNKKIKFKKFKIVLDCANGATYNIAPSLFLNLGHEVFTIYDKPSGTNINKKCGAVNVKDLIKKVLHKKADIGFAFDGDGDRIIAVDENGKEIDGDKIIALFCKHYLKNKRKKNTRNVVATVMSNFGFEKFLKETLKLKLQRTSVGDINVINKMKKIKSKIGGEQSGHIILSEFSNSGDGILAALKITEILSSENLIASKAFNLYDEYPQIKLNISFKKISNTNFIKIKKFIKKESVIKKEIRCLIRFSGTEPLIRVLVEGSEILKVKSLAQKIEKKIRSYID